jgi:hypothetical protein
VCVVLHVVGHQDSVCLYICIWSVCTSLMYVFMYSAYQDLLILKNLRHFKAFYKNINTRYNTMWYVYMYFLYDYQNNIMFNYDSVWYSSYVK